MKKYFALFAGAAFLAVAMSSCSKNDEFVGSWQSVSPVDITRQLPEAANGTSLVSVTFGPNTGQGGDFEMSSLVEATQGIVENPGYVAGYEVSVAATATISGKWMYEPGEDDDLIINFDQNSFKVDVDKDGVTFRQNQIDGVQEPVTDSLTTVTVNLWKQQISSAMRKEFNRYTRINDVKVKDSSTLKFEIDNPEQTFVFRKI